MANVGSLSGGSAGSITGQLDVNWIVEQIIYAKQQPIRDLETFEIFYEAKREAFQELNTRVSAVESALYDLNSSGFQSKTAALSTEDYLTASAATTASAGDYSIIVEQLAQAESYTADNTISDPDDGSVFTDGDREFVITPRDGSGAQTIDAGGKSLNQLKTEINSLGIDVTAAVIQYGTNDYRLVITADETGEDEGFTLSGDAALTTLGMDQKIANQDAKIYVNNPDEAISRSSNTITDVINGVTLNLKDADPTKTDSTKLSITADTSNLKENIQTFVDAFNDAVDYLNEQFTYNEQLERAGVLSGEAAAVKVKNDLLTLATSAVGGHDGSDSYTSFAIIGLEMDRTGHLEIDEEKLDDAIANDLDAVKRIFRDVGTTTNSEVSYVGKSDDAEAGTYAVNITQVAEQALVEASQDIAANLGQNETLTITYGGTDYTVSLTSGMTSAEVVSAINTEMDDPDNNVPVSARVSGNRLQLVTDDYGSSQSVTVVSNVAAGGGGTGIGTTEISDSGQDVDGTIGEKAASGSGRVLTGTAGDSKGMVLYIASTTTGDKGSVYFTRGVGESLRERMYELSFPYSGLLAKNIEALDDKLQNITDQIADINRTLLSEQELLIAQFTRANEALAQMTYLQSTLSNNFAK